MTRSRDAVLACLTLLLAAPVLAQTPAPAPPPRPPAAVPGAAPAPSAGAETPAEDAAPAADTGRPEWVDRLLFNAEERTRRGARRLEEKDYSAAGGAMESALKLAPGDPRAQYNAGTARLPVAPDRARQLLDAAAAAEADPGLAARAHYNLGNVHLETGALPEAVESYKQALRRQPDFEDAKFNLELAQRRLQQQQQQQNQDQQQDQDQQDQDQQDQQQDQEGQDQEGQDQQDQQQDQEGQDQQDQQQDQEGQDQQDQQQDQEGQGDEEEQRQEQEQQNQNQDQQDQQQGGQQEQQESPLPQFEDLPDMSAEEAAAILEAIENLEREQRRQQALEAAAATRKSGKKDW